MDWTDPTFKDSVLGKGQRQPTYKKAVEIPLKESLKCANCKLPFSPMYVEHCRCSIWMVGRGRS